MTKPVKIYWLHPHFLYWMGGTKYIFEVLKRLKSHYDLTVIVENTSSYAADLYQKAGIKLLSLHKLSTTSLLYWLTFPFQVWDTTRRIKNLVTKDALFISSMFPMNLVATKFSARPLQLCFEPFAFFHDPDFQQGFPFSKRFLLKLLNLLYGPWDIIVTRKARRVITLNQVTKKIIQEIYTKDSFPVYTGIDTGHFRHHVSPSLRAKYRGKEIIIHSTDYTPVKGTDKMIQIFAKVKKLQPNAHLLITTTINNPSAVKLYVQQAKMLGVEKSIEFLGFVDYNILPELYSLAKVLVQCSYSERSGTTSMALPVKEALSCGTAAIRAPVTTEDVEDGKTGYLVDPRDEGMMVKRIVDLLGLSAIQYRHLSARARAKIVKLYTWDQTVERIVSIIKAS
ncbi:MAG: glycosyltransferase [uncultured bacterium]|nr:MAG: glycosyltransferase [uncultured bacterium]